MESVLRGAAVYVFLLVLFRIAGQRTLSDLTTFDFVLLLIISEAIQQALIDSDNSMTHAFLIVLTLVALNIGVSLWKQRSPRVDRLIEGDKILEVRPAY